MSMCENCKGQHHEEEKDPRFISFVAHEKDMARMGAANIRSEKANRRSHILNVILALLLALSIGYTFWLKDQYQAVEESYEIEQDTDGGGNNYSVIGGDFNGKTENKSQDEEVHP